MRRVIVAVLIGSLSGTLALAKGGPEEDSKRKKKASSETTGTTVAAPQTTPTKTVAAVPVVIPDGPPFLPKSPLPYTSWPDPPKAASLPKLVDADLVATNAPETKPPDPGPVKPLPEQPAAAMAEATPSPPVKDDSEQSSNTVVTDNQNIENERRQSPATAKAPDPTPVKSEPKQVPAKPDAPAKKPAETSTAKDDPTPVKTEDPVAASPQITKTPTPAELADDATHRNDLAFFKRIQFTTDVVNHEPIDDITSLSSEYEVAYFYTDIVGAQGRVFKHRWSYKGEVKAEVAINVRGPRWRAHSSKQMLAGWKGEWTVDVLDEDGVVVLTRKLQYQ